MECFRKIKDLSLMKHISFRHRRYGGWRPGATGGMVPREREIIRCCHNLWNSKKSNRLPFQRSKSKFRLRITFQAGFFSMRFPSHQKTYQIWRENPLLRTWPVGATWRSRASSPPHQNRNECFFPKVFLSKFLLSNFYYYWNTVFQHYVVYYRAMLCRYKEAPQLYAQSPAFH